MKVNQNSAKSKRSEITMTTLSEQNSHFFDSHKYNKPNYLEEFSCCRKQSEYSNEPSQENETILFSSLKDEDAKPIMLESFEEKIINKILLDDLISMLSKIKPIYGKIFLLLYEGATQQEIANELGVKVSIVLDDISKIRSIVQPFVKDIFHK